MQALAATCVAAPILAPGTIAAQTARHPRTAAPKAVVAAAAPTPVPVITLERTACNGQCAEYRLAFFDDGLVTYDGVANVSKSGRWYTRVPPETIDRLKIEFRRIGFDTLQSKYPGGITPTPLATLTLHTGGHQKSVTHELGSPFPPQALSTLEDRLDITVGNVAWAR